MFPRLAVSRLPVGAGSGAVRELAKKAVRSRKGFDPTRGWARLHERLSEVPVHLPALKKLEVVFGRAGDGHTAARHFVRMHLAQLRFQNPDASVSQSSSKLEKSSRVSIELDGGEAVELNVTGLANRTEVLRQVLGASGMEAAEVEAAAAAATSIPDVTIDAAGYCGERRAKGHGFPPRVIVPLPRRAAE